MIKDLNTLHVRRTAKISIIRTQKFSDVVETVLQMTWFSALPSYTRGVCHINFTIHGKDL